MTSISPIQETYLSNISIAKYLYVISTKPDPHVLEILIDQGYQMDEIYKGYNAIELAIIKDFSVLIHFLENGLDPNIMYGSKPLLVAMIREEKFPVVEILLQYGAEL